MRFILLVCIFFNVLFANQLSLTPKEQAWIDKRHTVRVRVGDFPPFQIHTKDGFTGISVEIIEKIFKKHNILYTLVSSKNHPWHEALRNIGKKDGVDLLLTAIKTIQRQRTMAFANTYFQTPRVIFTREDSPFIGSMEDLNGKRVSVQKGFMMHNLLLLKYPLINLHVKSSSNATEEALRALARGEVDAYVGDLVTGLYLSKKLYLEDIKVAAPTSFADNDNSFAIRRDWGELVSIINKELASMTTVEKNEIINKYLFFKIDYGSQEQDLINWIGIIVFILLVILLITYRANQKRAKEIGQRKELQQELAQYIELMDKYVITSSTDLDGNITHASEAFCEISKYSKEELLGKNHRILRHPDMPKHLYKGMWGTITKGRVWKGEIKNRAKDGSIYWVKAYVSPRFNTKGKIIGYTSIREDITDKKRVEELSITDSLTTLYNRRYFDEILLKEINIAKRNNQLMTYIMFDVDHFKQYNDTYGHQMGDEVLKRISHTTKEMLHRSNDYAFRLGGEEFGLLVLGLDRDESLEFCTKLKDNIENLQIPHSGNSVSKHITVSIGFTCKKANDVIDKDTLYKETDDLLYEAKAAGRNIIKSNH